MKYLADILYIEKFRKFTKKEIKLGKKINVFSGQNGVGKSNLLSLIATTFGTKDRRATGGNFFPEFSDYFIINENENFKEYKSYLKVLIDDTDKFEERRHGYKDSRNENRGIRVLPRPSSHFGNDSTTSQRKIPVPTIFLSLSRLFPVGETTLSKKGIRSDNRHFNEEIFEKYKEWYNFILPQSISNIAGNNQLIHKNVVKNSNLHIELNSATPETQSVGQDNIGCIISALIDFYILKDALRDKYSGGILCIDEVDASLHPDAQLRLFKLLERLSNDLSLQIFLSTHSLTINKEILRLQAKSINDYKMIYILDPMHPRISEISSYEELKADLFDKTNYYRPKVKVYCEDEMTNFILAEILSDNTLKLLNLNLDLPSYEIIPVHLGCNNLEALPECDNHFRTVAIVLDGDAKTERTHLLRKYINGCDFKDFNPLKLPENCVALPTYLPPESFLYYISYQLVHCPEYNSFWDEIDKIPEARLYTKSKLMTNVLSKITITDNFSNDSLKNKEIISELKDFFKRSKAISYYYTQEKNKDEILEFLYKCKKVFELSNNRMKANL
jgi:prophage lp2 protein 4